VTPLDIIGEQSSVVIQQNALRQEQRLKKDVLRPEDIVIPGE